VRFRGMGEVLGDGEEQQEGDPAREDVGDASAGTALVVPARVGCASFGDGVAVCLTLTLILALDARCAGFFWEGAYL